MAAQTSTSSKPFSIVAVIAIGFGALIAVFGLLVLPTSLFGGLHIAAIGITLLLAGLFATEWARTRWNLSPTTQKRLVWGFLALSIVLLVAFIIVSFSSFEGPFTETGSESGN
jgi:membrane protease YdiL (CAAX protease family)